MQITGVRQNFKKSKDISKKNQINQAAGALIFGCFLMLSEKKAFGKASEKTLVGTLSRMPPLQISLLFTS